MAGETCRPTGTILKYVFQRWMLWHVLAYGFRITTLFRFVVLLGHACLPDSTQLKTVCGVAPVVSRLGHPGTGELNEM